MLLKPRDQVAGLQLNLQTHVYLSELRGALSTTPRIYKEKVEVPMSRVQGVWRHHSLGVHASSILQPPRNSQSSLKLEGCYLYTTATKNQETILTGCKVAKHDSFLQNGRNLLLDNPGKRPMNDDEMKQPSINAQLSRCNQRKC